MPEARQARVTAQLKLALLGDCGCDRTMGRLEREARSSGMTGAEIDAALAGRSFEARTAAIVAYACALKAGETDRIEQARSRASQIGITAQELSAIARKAKQILASKQR
jgi:hypothetical protein